MIKYRWVLCFLGVSVVVGWDCAAGCTGPPAAQWSAERLRSQLSEAQRRIQSFYVVYRSERGSYHEPEYPPGAYVQRIVAAKAPYYAYHVGAHGHDQLDWQDDPLQQRGYVVAVRWWGVNPVNRTYFGGELRPEDPLPGSMPEEFFFWATGIWPLDQRPPPRFDGQPYVLREVAACADYKDVRPQQEMVDGHWCHVLERAALDHLWLDDQRGCILLARETHSPTSKVLMQRIELGGHREVTPGVWMPMWIRNIQYDFQARTEEARRRKVRDALFEVQEIKVNQVEDSLFDYQPPPGALLLASPQPPTQIQPGGLAHLDHLVRWVRMNSSVGSSPASSWSGYFAGLPALLVILAVEAWRRWQQVLRSRRATDYIEGQATLPGAGL